VDIRGWRRTFKRIVTTRGREDCVWLNRDDFRTLNERPHRVLRIRSYRSRSNVYTWSRTNAISLIFNWNGWLGQRNLIWIYMTSKVISLTQYAKLSDDICTASAERNRVCLSDENFWLSPLFVSIYISFGLSDCHIECLLRVCLHYRICICDIFKQEYVHELLEESFQQKAITSNEE